VPSGPGGEQLEQLYQLGEILLVVELHQPHAAVVHHAHPAGIHPVP
jgi:hypothetical protein